MEHYSMIKIEPQDLFELGIPSNITIEKLNDSGYTYRFAKHKKHVKRLLAEYLLKDVEFEFVSTGFGTELRAKVDL